MALAKRGYSKHEIANKLGVDYKRIAADYNQIMRRIAKNTKKHHANYSSKILLELEEVKREAWEAWEKSKKPSKKIVSSETPTGEVLKTVTIEGRIPEAKYLAVIEKCIESEKKLLGLDAPKKVDLNVETDIPWKELANKITDETSLKNELNVLIMEGIPTITHRELEDEIISPATRKEIETLGEVEPRYIREEKRDNEVIVLTPEQFEVKPSEEEKPFVKKPAKKPRRGKNAQVPEVPNSPEKKNTRQRKSEETNRE